MTSNNVFNAGGTAVIPEGDAARQAIDSLRGYAYQVLAAALAWVDIGESAQLFLEVAEDFAIAAQNALDAVQIKDTAGSVTLNTGGIRDAVAAYVDLAGRNPSLSVQLHYFTTSEAGTEQALADRPAGMAGLTYWRKAAAGADAAPLRALLEGEKFAEPVRAFVKARGDAALRTDLLQKVHWHCGKPDFLTLRQELEARLVVIGRDRFGLPALEARRLADILVYRVLRTSILKEPKDRVLTRAQLYEAIDSATRVSMPRAALDPFAGTLSTLAAAALGGSAAPQMSLAAGETNWIINGESLPAPRGIIHRQGPATAASAALDKFSACVLTGASGLGKSLVARAVAAQGARTFALVDFRGIDAKEARQRLDTLFAMVGGLELDLLILDDLNGLDDQGVSLSFARVLEALRRRDRAVVVTCYRPPSAKALTAAGLDLGCVIQCEYFSQEETAELVQTNGGAPKKWGPIAFVAGASGHPQLTHAFVAGMAARCWPVGELPAIVARGLTSEDIEVTRDAARRNLAAALPKGARNLLYRLGLIVGRFRRPLALSVAALPPPIAQAGEHLDSLVGPWVEAIGPDRYRVSPLASTFGREMLTVDEQTRIHQTVAEQLLSAGSLDAGDLDLVLMHALAGKAALALAVIARSVVMADDPTRDALRQQVVFLPILQTHEPILPDNPSVSAMLRLAQFKLAAVGDNLADAAAAAAALFREVDAIPHAEARRLSEAMALGSVLCTMGAANFLDDWVVRLHRLKVVIEADSSLKEMRANVEKGIATGNFFGALFGIGAAGLASVQRLEHIINELDKLDARERALWLTPVDKAFSTYSVLINGPWAAEERTKSFNATDAATRYQRMADKTRAWSIRALTVQCWIARAVMLDEYLADKEGALAVLDQAIGLLGDDLALTRARAKIHWRHGEHAEALALLRAIADQIGQDDPVERAFALREAAISAGKCSEWEQAERWFLEAQAAARLAKTPDMAPMAIGLGADAAVAAMKGGNRAEALSGLAHALEALSALDPSASLRAAYVHRVIRHAILWAQSLVEGKELKIGDVPITMEAGACSNPDPVPAVRNLPLGPIDAVWYLLAETEAAAGLDLGIAANIDSKLTQGPIPVMQSGLHVRMMQVAIDQLDPARFVACFWTYIDSAIYRLNEVTRIAAEFNPLEPERGQILAVSRNPPYAAIVEQVAADAILAYGMHAALTSQPQAIKDLEVALAKALCKSFPARAVFDQWNGQPPSAREFDQIVADILGPMLAGDHMAPRQLWAAGFRMFEKLNNSQFKQSLTARLAAWLRAGWNRVVATETFRLSRPRQTVPAIQAALAIAENDARFIASLLLAASEAVAVELPQTYRDQLTALSQIATPPASNRSPSILGSTRRLAPG